MTYQEAIKLLHPDTSVVIIPKMLKEQGFDATIKSVNESNLIAAEGLEKLMEYEKTGLTPEQIYEIDKLYTEKCRELAELKKKEDCDV